MKNLFLLSLTLVLFGCSKSKKIAPNLKITKISEFPICGFHDVYVYDINSHIELDSSFFQYPTNKYLYSLYPSNAKGNHKLLKWNKIDNTFNNNILEHIEYIKKECNVYLFEKNVKLTEEKLYYSGIEILTSDNSFIQYQALLFLNVEKKKLYIFKYYDIGMPFS